MTQTSAEKPVAGRDRDGVARRLAADLRDGFVVNLGVGIPLLVPKYVPDGVEVILHAENGVLGMGPLAPPGQEDPDLTDAGKQPITLMTGAAIVDSATSFAVVRGGHLDVTGQNPAVGGAMDLVAGAREVWVAMEHADRRGQPKIVERCTFPLTGRGVVTRVYTDLAVFHIVDGQLRLTECAPGITPDVIAERTGATFIENLPG
jgi:3-oxoacid CoA-transferase subunit B